MSKERKSGFVIVLLVAGAVWYFFRNSMRIDVGTPTVSFLAAAGNGIRINVKLPILNRGNVAYPIEGFLGQILYGQTALGNVTLKQPVTIPARATAEPEFIALINWGALATETYGALSASGVVDWILSKIGLGDASKIKPITWNEFSIRGTLYAGGLSMDINQKLT